MENTYNNEEQIIPPKKKPAKRIVTILNEERRRREQERMERENQNSQASNQTSNQASESKKDVNSELLKRIQELEKRDEENQKQLKMLYEVADKSRVFNYEMSNQDKKPIRVKLSVFQDKYVVGWRTVKDKILYHPSTGKPVGEEQEYEVLLYDKNSETTKMIVQSYSRFSDIRYGQREECEVVGKREDVSGNVTFDITLSDGRKLSIDSKFIN